MATSSGTLARDALDALSESGVRFALLHGEAEAAAGLVSSDLDLVVGEDPLLAIRRARPALRTRGLHPVVVGPYDVAHTAITFFLATGDAEEGVQLEPLCDPRGIGRYGIRSGPLLEVAAEGQRWPRLTETHELLYLLRKRQWKQDQDRLEALLARARAMPSEEFHSAVRELFAPPVAGELVRLVERYPHHARPSRVRHRLRRSPRNARRLVRPIGYWVELRGGDEAEATARAISTRFSRFLPHGGIGPRPTGFGETLAWWGKDVAPVRWRAGLFVSWGPKKQRDSLEPDLVVQVDGRDVADLCRDVVRAMEGKLRL